LTAKATETETIRESARIKVEMYFKTSEYIYCTVGVFGVLWSTVSKTVDIVGQQMQSG
jgi:hypothetical protein